MEMKIRFCRGASSDYAALRLMAAEVGPSFQFMPVFPAQHIARNGKQG